MDDSEARDTDGADPGWIVIMKKCLTGMKRRGGRGVLRKAYGENPSEDKFLRPAGFQMPDKGYRLGMSTPHQIIVPMRRIHCVLYSPKLGVQSL